MTDDRKEMAPAARRALAEAEKRRKSAAAARDFDHKDMEVGGPSGEEPTRFGDWERKGRAVDF